MEGERVAFEASPRDPIGTTHAVARRLASDVERALFRQLKRAGSPWEVLREAAPIQPGERLLCPVLWYRRRIDVPTLLAWLEGEGA